jgi:AraC-like DNA-binding protein
LIEQQAVAVMRQLPATPIAQLARELGYSSRQLQRKLNDFVGLSPRLYKRICRFEKALALIHAALSLKPIRWSALARACGYSDQAHFIRDFHELAGCTPAQYLTSLSAN